MSLEPGLVVYSRDRVGYSYSYSTALLTVICLMVIACCLVLAPPSMAIPSFLLTFATGMVRISPCRLLKPPNDKPAFCCCCCRCCCCCCCCCCGVTTARRREGRPEDAWAMKSSRPVAHRMQGPSSSLVGTELYVMLKLPTITKHCTH